MAGHEFSLTPVRVPTVKTQHRRIVTPIPHPSTVRTLRLLREHEPRSMGGTLPLLWDHAEGYQVFDGHGNCWIDFTSTIFVANAGHSHPKIRQAIETQSRQRRLHNYCYPSELRLQAVRKLTQLCPKPLRKAFLLSTGSEATECALKLVRLYGQTKAPIQNGVLCFDGAMHGRTLGAQTMGGNPALRKWILHPDPEIYHLPFPWKYRCPWRSGPAAGHECGESCFRRSLEQLEAQGVDLNTIAGIMIEPYLGWGALFFPKDYVRAMRRWADQQGALVVFDEVQSGFGRTGTLFAFQQYGITPDLLCLGKGISSSLPLSAVVGRADVMDLPEPGSMSSTHTGNPLCCAAAVANLDIVGRASFVTSARRRGEFLRSRLEAIQKRFPDRILSVEGRGMVYALIVVKPGTDEEDSSFADAVCERALRKGLLVVHTGRGSIKLGPPLMIPASAIAEAATVLEEAFAETLATSAS